MSAELFLIAPTELPTERLTAALDAALARDEVAALLLPRGTLGENAYKTMAKAIVPMAQAHGTAVLVEGKPGIVRLLGADGLHVSGDVSEVEEAIEVLKPDLIVGVGEVDTRDNAMVMGELGVDYILFGPLSGAISAEAREMARWWAETMEVPSVLSDPAASAETYEAEGCEFIGLRLPVTETVG